jgi:hypothetical protein
MRNRHVDPHQHDYDGVLRRALHTAADSLEPGADGLDQIRAKIAAKESARRKLGWWAAATQREDGAWWRALIPPPGWLPAAVGAVAERFRPDPLRAGWFGWLRPAAAVFTGLFVATAASWAVAALPSALNPSPPPGHHHTSPSGKSKHSATGSHGYTTTGGTAPSSQGSQGGGSTGPTPTCSPTPSTSPSTSPSGSPSPSGTPTGSPSPTTTPSTTPPSPTSTPTPNTPTSSPTVGGGSAAPAPAADRAPAGGWTPAGDWAPVNRPAPANSPDATGKALFSPDAIAATQLARNSAAGGLTEPGPGADMVANDGPVLPTASPTVSGPGTPIPTSTPPPPC